MEIFHMAALAAMLLAAPFLLGMLFGKETVSGTYIAGALLLWGSFQAVAIAANLRGWDFQMLSRRFLFVLAALVCAGIAALCVRIIGGRKGKCAGKDISKKEGEPWKELLLIVPAFLLVGSLFFVYAPKLESWYLVPETVNTILDTNSLHGFHPLTGQPLSLPKGFGERLMNLPAFYACLARWFQLETTGLLFHGMSLWVLFISFLVYNQFAAFFFGKWQKGRILFMWVYALVLLLGDGAYMNEAYQMLHYAYEGRAVLTGVLLPYCLYLLLTAFFGFSVRLKHQEGVAEGKGRINIFRVFSGIAEYVLLFLGGLLVLGVDYGLGLLSAMTVLSCIAGVFRFLVNRLSERRRKGNKSMKQV